MTELSREHFNRIVALLAPHVQNGQQQQQFLNAVFWDVPGIINAVAPSGTGQIFATMLVRQASIYGEIKAGEPAIGRILEALKPSYGPKVHQEMDDILSAVRGEAPAPPEPAPAPAQKELPHATNAPAAEHIFISYSSADRYSFADRLVDDLKDNGYKVWIDNLRGHDNGIIGGQPWQQALADNINAAAAVIVLLTPDSVKSDWVNAEVRRARELKKPVLPLVVRDIKSAEDKAAFSAMNIRDLHIRNLDRDGGYKTVFPLLLNDLKHVGV